MARLIVVVGGGWAGCAAAVELAQNGRRVELHEAGASLGGRARSVVREGLPLDNGEHLLLGAYVETLRLASVIHAGARSRAWLTAPLAIRPWSASQRNALTLQARSLPAPLGLLAALLGARGLTWRERVATVRWFAGLRRSGFRCSAEASVADVLAALPARSRENLWEPLCVAALNTLPAAASAQVFLNVLREAFGGAADAARTVLPRAGLASAVPEPAAQWLQARGHTVALASKVRVTDPATARLTCADGERQVDAVVVAVGPHQLAGAFAGSAAGDPDIAGALRSVAALRWEPIVTVYLGYAADVAVPRGLVRLDDAPGQWLFDRGDILRRSVASPTRPALRALLSVVISAHGAHDALDHAALVAAIDAQLRRLRPALPPVAWSQVIAEKRATYACVPAITQLRCGRLSGRVYIAGDYTYPAFPATLEAAVRSGIVAARAIVADLPR